MVMASCQQQRFHPPDNTRRRRVSSMPKQLEASFHLQPHLHPPAPWLLGVKCERFVHAKSNQGEKVFSSLFISATLVTFFFSDFIYIFTGKITTLSLFEFLSTVLPPARTGIGIWGADGRIGHKLDYYLQIPHSLIG